MNSSSSLTLSLALCRCDSALAATDRSRHVGFARGIGAALPGAAGNLLARRRGGLADGALALAAHQIDVDVIVVIDVGARRQHGVELLTGGGLDVAQKSLLFGHALPAVLHRDDAPVRQRKGRDIQRIAEGVLGNMRARIAVHAAAGIGGDLLDLGHAGAEPAHRGGLHGIGKPAIERRDDRTGQRRGGLHRHRTEGRDRIALRRPEPRQRLRGGGTFRIGRRAAVARIGGEPG